MSILKRAARETGPIAPVPVSGSVHAVCVLPALQEFLSLERWDDGSKRRRGTISISLPEDRYVLWANDKDALKSAWISGLTLEEALLSFERGLTECSLEWRRMPEKFAGRGGK